MAFALDARLDSGGFFIADLTLCRVLLKNDKTWPWLQLIPRRENVREIYDLTGADREQLIHEIAQAGKVLNVFFYPAKINTAAIGNIVPQLHVHVIARFENDPAWPQSVWAVQAPEIPYTEAERGARIAMLRKAFEGEGLA